MAKDKRSNKWAFLIYQESTPENYLDILEEMHIPFVLSPWHDKDINKETGEFKKAHKHGVLFFEVQHAGFLAAGQPGKTLRTFKSLLSVS